MDSSHFKQNVVVVEVEKAAYKYAKMEDLMACSTKVESSRTATFGHFYSVKYCPSYVKQSPYDI